MQINERAAISEKKRGRKRIFFSSENAYVEENLLL